MDQTKESGDRINRRNFLKSIGVSALASSLSIFSKFQFARAQAHSIVAVSKGKNLDLATREAINAIGGMAQIIESGEKVFIKPNFAALSGWARNHNTITNGQCTKPRIVLAVAEECLKAGASQVIIGEAGQDRFCRWGVARSLESKTSLLAGVDLLNALYGNKVAVKGLNNSTPYWVFVPSRTEFGQIAVSSFVTEADKVISIPVLKTHHSCAVTISIKNFMGVTPIWLYGSPRMKLHDCNMGVDQCFLDVVKGIRPDLAVIDVSIGVERDGPAVRPEQGTTVDVKERIGDWLILAGTDLVAVDSMATRIIGHDPRYVKHLRDAFDQGMGEMRKKYIDLIGGRLTNISMQWQPSERSGYPQ